MKRDNFMEVAKVQTDKWIEPRIRTLFTDVAFLIFDRINRDDFLFESQTHNLRASIGIGIFKDGVLTDWVTNPEIPTTNKLLVINGEFTLFDGQLALNEALGSMDVKSLGEWVMVLVAAAPYALAVDTGLEGKQRSDGQPKRGVGWWSEDFAKEVAEEFRTKAKELIV